MHAPARSLPAPARLVRRSPRPLALLSAVAAFAVGAVAAPAAVKTETVEYQHDGTTFKGFVAYDDALDGPRPGVLVVHEWWGLNDYAKHRAEMLAEMGYVAFAVDMYGQGKTAKHPEEASKFAGMVRENVDDWRGRALAGLDQLKKHPKTDPDNLAAIGYCFGGATVLQMAYAHAPVKAVVSFHGALPAASAEEAANVSAGIMICHGAADPFVPPDQVEACLAPLEKAGADYVFTAYAKAKHGFTNPGADDQGRDGLGYDAKADARSWAAMRAMFDVALKGESLPTAQAAQ
ncbi:dienelactone hydrolase family protein [Alienimonas californiensis]|uniref:Dienelactone hydrolase family protein n=1 Tax=Alienimonas californiensis TaxID=2527989 RepID=A0A517PFI6_9PLAN|nr:dienelactone hydrolase family protein [Alienimonas californiensis]QDT18125.1 Dienelactone hydrolase family protein [Alienimonas californiensis]